MKKSVKVIIGFLIISLLIVLLLCCTGTISTNNPFIILLFILLLLSLIWYIPAIIIGFITKKIVRHKIALGWCTLLSALSSFISGYFGYCLGKWTAIFAPFGIFIGIKVLFGMIYDKNIETYWGIARSTEAKEKDKKRIKKFYIRALRYLKKCKQDVFYTLILISFLYTLVLLFFILIYDRGTLNYLYYYPAFTICKWLIFITMLFIAYRIVCFNKKSNLVLIFGTLAILYNPIVKLPFEKNIWGTLSVVTTLVLGITIFKLSKKAYKLEKNNESITHNF